MKSLEQAILCTACGAIRFATFARDDGRVPPYIEVPLIEVMGQERFVVATEQFTEPKFISATRRFRPFTVQYITGIGQILVFVEDGTFAAHKEVP